MLPRAGEALLSEVMPIVAGIVPTAVYPVGCEDAEELVQDALVIAAPGPRRCGPAARRLPAAGRTRISGWLAASLTHNPSAATAFNFGPTREANRTVTELVEEILKHWPGRWEDKSDPKAVHEAVLLQLSIDKANALLGWSPVWKSQSRSVRSRSRNRMPRNGGN